MAHGREKGGEFCENKAAPMIRECPDCVDAYVKRVEEFEKAAYEIQGQNCELRKAAVLLKEQRDCALLQVESLREALQHQKEIWDVALPMLKEVDSAHGFVPFDALHRPIWKIDKALAGCTEKRVDSVCLCPHHDNAPHLTSCLCCGQGMGQGKES